MLLVRDEIDTRHIPYSESVVCLAIVLIKHNQSV